MSINVNDKNLGHATAYAYYKAGGGTMTEAEFTEFMADFGTASQTAVEAAQAALASKNAAQTAATTATTKASEATTAATTATTKAAEASTSASTATSAKDTAVSASQTATSKASEATTAAATATSAKTDAVAANTAAQSAKTAAQTAQAGAETAAASVQSSAAQIQTNADDISELKEDLTTKADATDMLKAFPTDTASGAIASFSDGANVPVKSLIVNIDPVQSGSGDPSPTNVRPISGWSEVNVEHTGANVWEPLAKTGGFIAPSIGSALPVLSADYSSFSNDVLIVNAPSGWTGNGFISNPLLVGKTYRITGSITATTPRVQISVLDDKKMVARNMQALTTTGDFSITVTVATGERYIAIALVDASNGHIEAKNPCISESGDYEPYSGQSITISLGQTVYGGKLDVTNGVLTIDRAMIDIGTLNWTKAATQTGKWRFGVDVSNISRNNSGSTVPDILCEVYGAISPNDTYTGATGISNNVSSSSLFICDLSISEVADLKAVIDGKKVVYPLATPITVSITPYETRSLLGSNNVWADSGDSEVTYRADPTLYIQRKIAEALS